MAQQRICTHGLHLAAAPPSDLAKSIAADSAASARTPVTASCNMVDSSLPHFTLSFLTVECFQSSQMPSHVATHSLPLFPLQRHKEGGERQRERRETERDRERRDLQGVVGGVALCQMPCICLLTCCFSMLSRSCFCHLSELRFVINDCNKTPERKSFLQPRARYFGRFG